MLINIVEIVFIFVTHENMSDVRVNVCVCEYFWKWYAV